LNESTIERLNMHVAELGLPYRTTNILEKHGIIKIRDLLHSTQKDLLSIRTVGEKTLEDIFEKLERIGFYRQGADTKEKTSYAKNTT